MLSRQWIYKWRGSALAVLSVVSILFGHPSAQSLFLGSCLGLLGECLRFWAIGFTGGPTRGIALEAPRLVSAGPYAHLRNPLYLGNLLNGMAVTVAGSGHLSPGLAALVLAISTLMLWAFYRVIIGLEEQFLGDSFPDEYPAYCLAVPRLLPRLSSAGPQQGRFSLDQALFFEKSTFFWFLVVWTLLCLRVGQ